MTKTIVIRNRINTELNAIDQKIKIAANSSVPRVGRIKKLIEDREFYQKELKKLSLRQ